jgi:hypothetical protein
MRFCCCVHCSYVSPTLRNIATNLALLETKWGLGLKNLEDMPPENVYNFGLLQYMGAPL